MKNLTNEIPENQLTIFDVLAEPESSQEEPEEHLFITERANWHQLSHLIKHMPHGRLCEVVGFIPEDVKSPLESNDRGAYLTAGIDDKWAAYVWAIAQKIPFEKRALNDPNGWEQAGEILKEARTGRQPVELAIWDYQKEYFQDFEVIEYLPVNHR